MEWRGIDLHLHTPASNDYQQPGVGFIDILRKAEAEGLAMIAFTDHNTIAGYSAMRQEITDLARWEESGRLRPEEKAKLGEYRSLLEKITVLPGFELTATFGFHILGIFDPETPTRTLEHLLLDLDVPFESLDVGETEVGATSDVLTAYHLIAEAGGLAIAAHANSSHGVAMFGFDFGGQTRIAYTQDPALVALEVTDLETTKRRSTASFFNGSKPQYPRRMFCIQGSDSHRIVGNRNNLGVGERATEVLLPEVSFQALKDLFKSNDFSRVRPYRRATEEPYDHVQAARDQGATIVQSFHEQMTRQGGRMHAVVRDVVAFANTNGGTIWVGVSPNAKVAPKGVDSPDEAIKDLRTEIERLVTPPLEVEARVLTSGGKNVLRVSVPKGNQIPYVLEGSKIYLRHENETSLAMRDEIVALIKRVAGGVPAEQPEPVAQAQAQTPAPARSSRRGRRSGGQQAAATQGGGTAGDEKQTEKPMAEAASAEPSNGDTPPEAKEAQETESAATGPVHDDDMHAPAPRTGVEIVESIDRKGMTYHTMRDLRDGGKVQNVTRSSARRLWRYAIALKEKGTFQEDKVTWKGDLGVWHRYLRAGRTHYDLVQRSQDGRIAIYYGVTDDGIHGPWRALVDGDE